MLLVMSMCWLGADGASFVNKACSDYPVPEHVKLEFDAVGAGRSTVGTSTIRP